MSGAAVVCVETLSAVVLTCVMDGANEQSNLFIFASDNSEL